MTTGTFTDEAATWARSKTITLVDRDALSRWLTVRPEAGEAKMRDEAPAENSDPAAMPAGPEGRLRRDRR
jgi:hypothetical protein